MGNRRSHLAASGKFSYFGQMDKPLTDAERERFLQSIGMIVQAFEECGIKLVPVSPEESRQGKEEDRQEDLRLLASGEMTAAQLQERNAFFKGPVKVLDKSASYR
jgi:hypothetical protein